MNMRQLCSKEPPICPDCHSMNTVRRGTGTCQELQCCNCGAVNDMLEVVGRGYAERIVPTSPIVSVLTPCPHCEELVDFESDIFCHRCGIDRSVPESPSIHIAHMWKKGSKIREWLEKGHLGPNGASDSVGKFLRTACGPHCETAKVCSQNFREMSLCVVDWRKGLKGSKPDTGLVLVEEGPKRSKKYRKVNHVKTYEETRPPVFFQCAEAGWFSEMINYVTESKGKEQSGNTRDESGAEEISQSSTNYPQS